MAKILLVEDDKILSDMYHRKLTLEGFEVVQAFNGQEGLDKAASEKPDLILLDIMMPVMDGITAFNKLKENPTLRDILVIFLSNMADTRQWVSVLSGGNYIVKSNCSLDDLVMIVKKKLGIIQ